MHSPTERRDRQLRAFVFLSARAVVDNRAHCKRAPASWTTPVRSAFEIAAITRAVLLLLIGELLLGLGAESHKKSFELLVLFPGGRSSVRKESPQRQARACA